MQAAQQAVTHISPSRAPPSQAAAQKPHGLARAGHHTGDTESPHTTPKDLGRGAISPLLAVSPRKAKKVCPIEPQGTHQKVPS